MQNVKNLNEIRRGTLCKIAKYTEFQLIPKGYPLQSVKNFNEILRGTPDILRGVAFDFICIQIPDSSVDCAGWDLGACISAVLGAGGRLQRNWGTPWGAFNNSLTFAGCACKYSIMKSSVSSIACWACRAVEGMEGRLAGFMAGCPADYTKPEWLRVV